MASEALARETAVITNYMADVAVRRAYVGEVRGLSNLETSMRNSGSNVEDIARAMHQARRDLGEKYKDMTSPAQLEEIYARNLEKYGDKLGPSVEYLRNIRGKTWEEIIESAKTTSDDFNRAAGI
ncbi:hypothetical protein [Paenibacillus cymbidii]|uniref:hypothetical protein n=1 Tax=Paenibacillus cymbidii TaxID=1639034 RepID=UPI001A9B06B3|nr:hypothetical protein [Paenibacillus cymbidii]